MKRPEMKPENHAELNRYFEQFIPSPRIRNIGFAVMSAMTFGQIHYLGDSDWVISEHFAYGGNVMLAPNHHSNMDTPTSASLTRYPVFEPLKGTTKIPAKAEIFDWKLLGKFFPHMGAHPVFKTRQFAECDNPEQLQQEAGAGVIAFDISHIDNGGNIVIFPEKTRNKDNPQVVQRLAPGIGKIATNVEDPSRLLIGPLGYAYRIDLGKDMQLCPIIVVGEPFCPAGMSETEVLEQTHTRMQTAVTRAFDIAKIETLPKSDSSGQVIEPLNYFIP